MTGTELALDTEVPAWIDETQVLADVLDILRLPPTDDDSDRIESMIPSAAALVEAFIDRGTNPLPDAPPMHPLVRTAMANITIELYRRKDAPFGVLNGWSPDEISIRINTNPIRGMLHVLLPLKVQFGIA